jgi:nucleoside-diphosphate-sugar epimerase
MEKIIMVTGGTGYIGAWVVKILLEKGYTVRMTVRDKSNEQKYLPLSEIAQTAKGSLEIWEADLLKKGSFDSVAKGAEAIIHIASPFTLRFNNAQNDLIDPALLGTRNVLNAASKSTSVRKVILTSSVAAIYGDNIDMKALGLKEFTEDHFNTTSSVNHQPYSFSKIAAEKEAWKMAKSQNQWKLIVKNPAFVLGPALTHTSNSESIQLMKDILRGKLFFGAPDLEFGFVDVRDVAKAHVMALENDHVSGRHILSERTMGMMQLCQIIKSHFPGRYRLPFMKAPKVIMLLVGRFFGVTPRFVQRNVGYPIRLNASRSKEKLGIKYRKMEDTVKEMVEQMHHHKLV